MARIEIVNQAKGRDRAVKQVWIDAMNKEIEEIARKESAKNGFDINQKNGLMLAIAGVIARPELMREAARKVRIRLENDGVIEKEDRNIVRMPGKEV